MQSLHQIPNLPPHPPSNGRAPPHHPAAKYHQAGHQAIALHPLLIFSNE
ncbi:hypothetical protein [Spirulina sp.]